MRRHSPSSEFTVELALMSPNEASLLRLVTAIVLEVSEGWETGRIYLNMMDE